MDPLSDVLALLKPVNYMSAGFDGGGDWAIQFPDQTGTIKSGAIVTGRCWLAVEGVDEPVQLESGDCFVLPRGEPFHLASQMGVQPVQAAEVFTGAESGGIVSWNGGGDVFIVSSRFSVSELHADMLLKLLPHIVHIRSTSDQTTLRWLVERMMQELRAPQPGSVLILQHLAHMILVQALRLHLDCRGVGLLSALADKNVGAAIAAMHEKPALNWTVQELGKLTGMSRSSFAQRFKETVGTSPIDYLTRWRMLLASDRLMNSDDPISTIAFSLGYESESAFSTAFKRIIGRSPRQYSHSVKPRA
ncbi:AraC family transcriptional regulator [Dickeya dadantii]|uniref:AraC-type DNA-binding domain-containing protein n=1 Tax=Dickeya dadantii (strain 3937) TaxID=198628 RepID=E0SD59_DICD3|nr:AraC family transcriptional regulator [Dickeya dadantii]ADM97376.1 AraC-type DNA-binding domain-containing protein [Dickeya dadantii 3937]MCL6404325.1 AraC family transcriptional regulator [Dickeya dadantii]NPE53889.1 AraC family transcriptional regulator [Dickeya dadantii]NPE65386.1 AraC family transcriptional regulator [Dickeya dadantii]